MTLDELQNGMLNELNKAHPKSASLFKITEELLKQSTGSIPEGPPMQRLLNDGLIDPADEIGHYRITSKGRKFLEAGGYSMDQVTDDKKTLWKKIFK